MNPMVYCGMYPADGAKYPRSAGCAGKAPAQRCGPAVRGRKPPWRWDSDSAAASWDLLHLEIIQERLEREYNLDLVTTAPGVIYKVHKTNGDTMVDLTNPSNLPDPAEIEYMEEPIVRAEIMVTSEFIGRDHGAYARSAAEIYQGMEYIEDEPCGSRTMICRSMRSSTTFSMP